MPAGLLTKKRGKARRLVFEQTTMGGRHLTARLPSRKTPNARRPVSVLCIGKRQRPTARFADKTGGCGEVVQARNLQGHPDLNRSPKTR